MADMWLTGLTQAEFQSINNTVDAARGYPDGNTDTYCRPIYSSLDALHYAILIQTDVQQYLSAPQQAALITELDSNYYPVNYAFFVGGP